MGEVKIRIKGQRVLRNVLILLAFVFCGFLFNAAKTQAAPVISIPSDDSYTYNDSITFYVGYDTLTIKEVKYSVGGDWISVSNPASTYSAIYKDGAADSFCSGKSYISTCTNVIMAFNISNLSGKTGWSVDSNGKFTIKVESSNQTLFVGGSSSASRTLTYDGTAPSISKVVLSRNDSSTSSTLMVGNVIKFSVTLSEAGYVASGVKVNFKLGGSSKSASCATSTSSTVGSFSCLYTIASGDSGSVSSVTMSGTNNIKDRYNNSMASTASGFTFTDSKSLSIDGVKPTVKSVAVNEGTFSSASTISVLVMFSESLTAHSSYVSPTMKVKFGQGAERVCAFSSIENDKIIYSCSPTSTDQGAFTFVSLTGGSKITDGSGNEINPYYPQTVFSKTIVDNNIPTINSVTVSSSECQTSGSNYYCTAGKNISMVFTFNMDVSFTSRTITVKFGGTNAKNSVSNMSYDSVNKTLTVIYTVNAQDNGAMTIEYNFSLRGVNGLTNSVTNSKTDCKVFVDNKAPEIVGIKSYLGDTEFTESTLHGTPGNVVKFKIDVKEDSEFTLNSSSVVLVDRDGNQIALDQNGLLGLTQLTVTKDGSYIVVEIKVSGECEFTFQIKVNKNAITDSFATTMASDYYSDLYTIDTTKPEFNVEVVYPQYKGFNNGGSWTLISGEKIDFEINSDDVDLKDYCVVTSTSAVCSQYYPIEEDGTYSYTFSKDGNKDYSFYVRVRDTALNTNDVLVSFTFKEMFTYGNGYGAAKTHPITVDVSMFANGTALKYAWFKEGTKVSFDSANITSKQDDVLSMDGESNFNGKYRVCINNVSTNDTLCSEYVLFDTKIDSFNVEVSSDWSNQNLPTRITFNDSSTIKCIAVGKNESDISCDKAATANVTIYRTSQAISPLTKYVISENGIYTFYIEDTVGNTKVITKTVANIDKSLINIQVFNNKTNSDTNLEIDVYKSEHEFKVTFDKDLNNGSTHAMYRYFFSKQKYTNVTTKDIFNAYYLNSSNKYETTSCNKSLIIGTPNDSGIYHLYIMAVDRAGNASLKEVNDIMVDSVGPVIKMLDASNKEVFGGSSSYIAVFEYSIVLEDKDSKLNLNKISYKWINQNNTKVLEKKYEGCSYDSNTCKILGSEIEFGAGIFKPTDKYRIVISAFDNAGNESSFISSEFMIDTTAPLVVINVDENAWYENGDVSFTVSKENVGTLNNIAYCLNDCFDEDDEFDLSKFKVLSVSTSKVIEKNISLVLENGVNDLYVYASDVFGNYTYENAKIKYDAENVTIEVKNLNSDSVVDLTGKRDLSFEFIVKDNVSGVNEYCIYMNNDETNKQCFAGAGEKEISRKHSIEFNGLYTIAATDVVGNKTVYNVRVVGIDTEPIEFDLSSNVKIGGFTNGDVTISVVNMRKFMVEDVVDRVLTIDYIKVPYDTVIVNNEALLFSENVTNNVYNKNTSTEFANSFIVSENMAYVVRIVDTGRNISYNYIRVNGIDRTSPFINTNKYPNNSDRIYVSTESGKNIRVFVKDDGETKVYKYSNEVIKLYFGADSIKDLSTKYNNYLGVKVCFDAGECVYNTYNSTSYVNEGYLINNPITIAAPYNFSGIIRYYAIDGAGNVSETYSFEVEYQNEVAELSVELTDINGNELIDTNKYSKIVATFTGEEVNDIITNTGVRYALVDSNVNLHNLLANNSQPISTFLSNHGFVAATSKDLIVTKANVDSNYYLWVYVVDLLNNAKLMKASTMIRLDTINPDFAKVNFDINKLDNTTYDLSINAFDSDYTLAIDSNNDGVFETLTFENNKTTFSVSGLDSINFKLMDSAGNFSVQSFSLSVGSKTYARVYQVGNTREANVVMYNLGSKIVTSFRYIVTNIDSQIVFDNNTINDDSITTCNGFEDTCKGTITKAASSGVYHLDLRSFNKDKKVVFYIYVDGSLIDLVSKNIVVDSTTPVVNFEQGNPNIISTINGENYEFKVSVVEDNLANLEDNKFIITTASNVTNFVSTYEGCTNSKTCARGLYNLDADKKGTIVINSNATKFSDLLSGTYYVYVYVVDDFNNTKIARSSDIYVDNENPVVRYSTKNSPNSYYDIPSTVYVGGAAKLRFSDNYDVKYFEVYKSGVLSTVCYIKDASSDTNCIRNNSGEIGFVIENGLAHYYLDNGNYRIKVFDTANNYTEVEVNVDGSDPTIKLYKKVGQTYEEQFSGKKLYSDLTNLYVAVEETNFNYLTIDLINTVTGGSVMTASRYSYNSEIGICLIDRDECEYGVSLVDLVIGKTIQYNKIVVNAFDMAGRKTSLEVNYDDSVPEIWTLDVGESVYIGGSPYTLLTGKVFNIEIGVNSQLNMDTLLEKFILDVDGMSYTQAKLNPLFKVVAYKEGALFDKDVTKYIGSYNIKISYTDPAGNDAEEKEVNVNVLDNTKPTITYDENVNNVEIKEEVTILGAVAVDNYGLTQDGETISKEKTLLLSDAVCVAELKAGTDTCSNHIVKISDNVYKFVSAGTYKFTYSITDLAGNSNSIVQTIVAADNQGPTMSSSVDSKDSFSLYFGQRKNGNVNIENITLSYPNSFDKGDGTNRAVEYVGLFGINNMGEKYKLTDVYMVSNRDNKLTYSFTKLGTYYLRFSSSDSNGNISLFEYEVVTIDNIAPVISGVIDDQIIEMGLEEEFSVEYILMKFNITATDNYDENVKIYYELNKSSKHSHEVILKVSDTSGNEQRIKLNVDIIDYVAPTVGDLMIDSQTKETLVEFAILGGSDNSSNWWHEYSVQDGKWIRVEESTKIEFAKELSQTVKICIKAVDAAGNESANQSCKNVLVDTKAPIITGINDGDIVSTEITVNVEDDRLDTVAVWFNNELQTLNRGNLPFKFTEVGAYQVIARDTLGNERMANFMINIDTYMNVVNDINAEEYTVNSIEFDKRFLVRVDVSYDANGYSNIYAKLDNVSIKANDLLYILGVVPETDSTFVIFSVNGVNIGNYKNGVNLIGNGNNFKEGINNEDCFVKFNDYYYAYVIVRENAYQGPSGVADEDTENRDDSALLTGLMVGLGTLVVAIVGYQIVKFKKKVRAA